MAVMNDACGKLLSELYHKELSASRKKKEQNRTEQIEEVREERWRPIYTCMHGRKDGKDHACMHAWKERW
jgi:hypothetical protein